MSDRTISVITAVYNAESDIKKLAYSLQTQTDKDFEWIVVDGNSTDNTLKILYEMSDFINMKIISEPDFGIYDAFNKGIKCSSSEFYLVAGSDDYFYPNAIENYKQAIMNEYDLYTASVKMGSRIGKPLGSSWRYGMLAFISCHSVGVMVRKKLHDKFGYYSNKFPIAADQLFIKNCCQNGVKVKVLDFISGEYGTTGVSATDMFGGCTEMFRVQLLTNENKWIQYFILILKLTLRMFR